MSTLSFDKLLAQLEGYQTKLLAYDRIHQQKEFFALMKSFRRFVGSIDDKELCATFFHSKYCEGFKEFFRGCNNYYIRALEMIEALSVASRCKYGNKHFIDLMDAEHIKYNYAMKGESMKAVKFQGKQNLVMVGC